MISNGSFWSSSALKAVGFRSEIEACGYSHTALAESHGTLEIGSSLTLLAERFLAGHTGSPTLSECRQVRDDRDYVKPGVTHAFRAEYQVAAQQMHGDLVVGSGSMKI